MTQSVICSPSSWYLSKSNPKMNPFIRKVFIVPSRFSVYRFSTFLAGILTWHKEKGGKEKEMTI